MQRRASMASRGFSILQRIEGVTTDTLAFEAEVRSPFSILQRIEGVATPDDSRVR